MCFFLKMLCFFWTLPVLLQRWFSTCLVCVHTLTPRENRVRNILKIRKKNTIINEHPVEDTIHSIFIGEKQPLWSTVAVRHLLFVKRFIFLFFYYPRAKTPWTWLSPRNLMHCGDIRWYWTVIKSGLLCRKSKSRNQC